MNAKAGLPRALLVAIATSVAMGLVAGPALADGGPEHPELAPPAGSPAHPELSPPAGPVAPVAGADRPMTLEDAVARALVTHPGLVVSRDEARKALLALQDAQSRRVQLSADLSAGAYHDQYNILGPGGTQPPSDVPSADGAIDLTIPVFTGWKNSAEIDAAHQNLDASDADRDDARQTLELSVIEAFWTLRKDELLAQNDRTVVSQAQLTWRSAKAGQALGTKTPDDVDQAELSVLSARSDLLAQEAQTQQARAQLAQLLDRPPAGLAITGTPDASPSLDLLAMAAPAAALARRPDVQAALLRIQAAQSAVVAAKGALWPQIALSTSYEQGNLATNPVTGVRQVGSFAGTWQAQIAASYDLFDMGATWRKVESARLDRQEAQARYDTLALQVRSDLAQALAGATSAQERAQVARREVALARAHLAAVQIRYRDGLALEVEVDDARSKFQTALDQRVEALIDSEIALAQLRRAAGLL